MEGLKDLLAPKTLHWFSYVANVCWFVPGTILSAILLDIENSEPTDFRCDSNGDRELIDVKCYEQYEKQYNKFVIPVYGFVIINFLVTASVGVIYSQAVKSKVEELENPRNADDDVEGRTPRKKLFKAYCLQLLARFAFGISFVLLQTKLLYPLSFPSNFNCNLTRDGNFSDITANATRNGTQTQMSYECHNQRAAKKTFWADAVILVTGVFAFLVFIESLYLLWRTKRVQGFTEDPKFHKYYLNSNTDKHTDPEQVLLTTEPSINRTPHETLLAHSIEQMKKHVREVTERPYKDLKSPFDDPGEGRDLKLDEIFTNLIVYKGRAKYDFSGDRGEQLKEYHKANENLRPTRPGDIFEAVKQKILVVGRPGVGKTLFSTKILRDWASDNLLNKTQKSQIDFKVAFLVKLRMFNSTDKKELNLRELLDHSEYSTALSEEAWSYIRNNPKRVLIIFDGFDEYSGKTKVNKDDGLYRNSEEDRMPVHFLLKKIVSRKLLTGATVLITTRPNAVPYIRSLDFNRTVEILGFSTKQVEDYVDKFSKQGDKAETIKQHITSNSNLLAFCYIPVNCYIVCSCLLQLLRNTTGFTSLPTRLTEIYSVAIKMFYFCYDDNQYRHDKAEGQPFILKKFKELSSDVQDVFARLGKIAFDGIREGKLIFESHEVKNLASNGLFHRLPDSFNGLTEGRAQYCFMHLTMQEFFAAKHLVDTYSSKDLQKFVSNNIQEGAWKVVMQFVAGLLAEKGEQSTDIFSDLLPSKTFIREVDIKMNEDSEQRSETLTCWPAFGDMALVVTLFNCMYENKASDREVQKKLAKIGCNALDFAQCSLSPLDCLALVHALKSVEGILDFNLRFNNLQSLGCIEIAKLLPGNQHNQGFCELERLDLGFNNITDEAVKRLSTALTHANCRLNNLGLAYNNISDKGVKHLSTALTHTNCKLNSLHLENNNITDKGENLLKSMNINCKVFFF